MNLIFFYNLKDLIGYTLIIFIVATHVSISMLGAGISSNNGDTSSTEDPDSSFSSSQIFAVS